MMIATEGDSIMATQTLTLTVPDQLLARIRRRAERANRSVEAELVDVLTGAVPSDDELPADLANAIEDLRLLDDTALWQAARSRLSPDESAKLEQLHRKRQRDGLADAEDQELQ